MFDDTVIDGEVVGLDESGRPDFHRLQHFTAEPSRLHYFVFDLLILKGHDLTQLTLTERRKLLKSIKLRSGRIRISEQFDISAADMLSAVRKQQLEGIVEAENERLRRGKAHGLLVEDANQQGSGIRNRWLHAGSARS